MKATAVVLFCLAIALTAHAGQNPIVSIFLVDEYGSNYATPTVGVPFTVYVCLERFGPGGGLAGVNLKLDRYFSGTLLSYDNLLGGASIGGPEDSNGWMLAAPSCAYPDSGGILVVGSIEYVYFGTPGDLYILGHSVYGGTAVDCNSVADEWCVRSDPSGHLGVHVIPYDGDCDNTFPDIEVAPPSFSFDVQAASTDTDTLFISNAGTDTLVWSIPFACGWVDTDPDAGAVPPDSTQAVLVSVDSHGLGGGSFECDLEITSDDPYDPLIEVPVSLYVQPGSVVINEIYPDPRGEYDGAEFIELRNTTSYSVDIGGWILCGTEYDEQCGGEDRWEFPAGATIAAWDYIVVAKDGEDGEDGFYETFGFHPDFEMYDPSFLYDHDDPSTPNLILLDDDFAMYYSDEIQLVGGRGYGVMCQGRSHADVVYLYADADKTELMDLVEYYDPAYCDEDPCPGDDVYDDNAFPGVPLEGESLGRADWPEDTDNSSADWYYEVATPGQGNIMNRPPRISQVRYSPIPPAAGQPTYVSAIVTDESGVVTVTVSGDSDEGPVSAEAFADPGDSVYVAELPSLLAGTHVTFDVTALDDGGVSVTSEEAQYYVGLVDSIAQIQRVSLGWDESPWVGYPKNVQGVVTAASGTFSDESFYIHDATGPFSGIRVYTPGYESAVGVGDQVTVCGTVNEYNGETELILHFPEALVVNSTGHPGYGVTDVTAEQVSTFGFEAEQYEGQLVRVLDATVTLTGMGYGQWYIGDASSYDAQVDDNAGYEYVPHYNDSLSEIIGIVRYSYGEYEIDPRGDDDIIGPPRATDVQYGPVPPEDGESLTVTADLTDDVAITWATVYVGTTAGNPDTSFAMTPAGRGVWSAEIGSYSDDDRVFYHVECGDGTMEARKPSGGQYSLFVGMKNIYDVQYSTYGPSPLDTLAVNVQGYVTVEPGVLGDNIFYIADAPGAWNGIGIFDRTGTVNVARGDYVTCCGRVDEYYDETQIALHFPECVIPSTPRGEPIAATSISTYDISNPWIGEEWEGVYVYAENCEVMETSAGHGEWQISNGAPTDTCRVNDTAGYGYQPSLGDEVFVRGVVVYSYGAFKIEPRDDADIAANPVGVPDGPEPYAFRLLQNAPNPFNPVTQIRYELPLETEVTLRVYDLAGRLVRELVSGRVERAGPHEVSWNGRDDAGRQVGSGVYLYRLETGGEVLGRKMILLK